jgi:membrane protease YdiL (CAAX protease family)
VPVAWRWWHVAVAIGLFPVVSLAFVGVDLALGKPLHGGPAIVVNQLLMWGAVLWWLRSVSRTRGTGSFRDDYGLSMHLPDDLRPGIGTGLLAFVVQIAVGVALVALTHTRSASTSGVFRTLREQGDPWFWVTILLPLIGAPYVEELVFRGLTLRAMQQRLSPYRAAIASAALFGLFHWRIGSSVVANLELAIVLGCTGFLFARVDQRHEGRLGPSMLAHATLNAIATLFIIALH